MIARTPLNVRLIRTSHCLCCLNMQLKRVEQVFLWPSSWFPSELGSYLSDNREIVVSLSHSLTLSLSHTLCYNKILTLSFGNEPGRTHVNELKMRNYYKTQTANNDLYVLSCVEIKLILWLNITSWDEIGAGGGGPEFTVIRCFGWFCSCMVDASWNVMAHAQKPDFVFRRNGRVHLNWRGRQIIRLLAATLE